MSETTTIGDSLYVDVAATVRFAEGKVDEQPYDSRWSLRPLLDRSDVLTDPERAWLEGLEHELAALPADSRARRRPLAEEQMRRLVRFFFPPFKESFRYGALVRPLSPSEIIVTADWQELLASGRLEANTKMRRRAASIRAGMVILNQHYGQELEEAYDSVLDYRHADTGLVSHLRVITGFDYVEVLVRGEKPRLSLKQIRQLLGSPEDHELWTATLPPSVFHFRGMEINHVLDSTAEVARSRLQHFLLKREAVLSEKRMQQNQSVLRNYLRVPDLRLGVMALDYPLSRRVAHRYLIRQDILAETVEDILSPEYGESIYYRTCANGTVRIFDDLRDCKDGSGPLDQAIVELGYKSLVLVPLFGRGEHVIGMLELASEQAYAFSNLVLYQLESITPLFRQALRRSRDDMEARIQSVMRKTFTALDPSVEWKFIEMAAELIDREQSGEEDTQPIEPIRFEDVWALYAQADIVSSSAIRNDAIRTDLLNELHAARQLLVDPSVDLRFPLAGKLVYDIDELRADLEDDMTPNEEQHVIEFLHYSFAPTLEQLRATPELTDRVVAYEASLEKSRAGELTEREAYERSVRKVTSVVSSVISAAQEEAQRIVPHYFSKYRTDGVEFNIYAGASLLQDGAFSEIHLQNLRLWQLQTMVDVTKATNGLRSSLHTEMSTAQLIFAFGNTITIQFRMDEKRFDVEGAYNVRYEVIKKRIDKALVRGTEERLTIADHVAIVYSHHSDREVYHGLIDYLHNTGEVVGQAEDLELEPMQGVDGLYALRVRVI